jgi:pantetheine-phosphate adenylyltransferase
MGDAAELIRATDHFQEAAITHRLKDILLCVDLAILGQDDEVYQNYTRAIRQEYIHLPDATAPSAAALAHLSRKAQAGSCSATPTSPTSTTSAPSTTCSAKWSAWRSPG